MNLLRIAVGLMKSEYNSLIVSSLEMGFNFKNKYRKGHGLLLWMTLPSCNKPASVWKGHADEYDFKT